MRISKENTQSVSRSSADDETHLAVNLTYQGHEARSSTPSTYANERHSAKQTLRRWPAKDGEFIVDWLRQQNAQLDGMSDPPALHPSILRFKAVVEGDEQLAALSRGMFDEIPNVPIYRQDPVGNKQVKDFDHMLRLFNMIIRQGPPWYYEEYPLEAMSWLGAPMNAILNWPMATESGYYFWRSRVVNQAIAAVLGQWSKFLMTPESRDCLNRSDGWLSPKGLEFLQETGNSGEGQRTFSQLYNCDPTQPYHGFAPWDDFFLRTFRDGVRPVYAADTAPPTADVPDPTRVIVNSCESKPLQYVQDVKWQDQFWIKQQPYSLVDMLDNTPGSNRFAGGSVYQAYLDALSYHRWHAPVSGRVVAVHHVPGTYYSECYYEGFHDPEGRPDPLAATGSQPFLSAVATRSIIYIEAQNEAIGLMAAVYIGMGEVSSCECVVKEGQWLKKGQQIGMFHYGGSSHCLVFRRQTKLRFANSFATESNFRVNDRLAMVVN